MSHHCGRQTDTILGNEKIGNENVLFSSESIKMRCGTFLTVHSCYKHASPYEKKGSL
jgi:hypothetical protein